VKSGSKRAYHVMH